MPVWMHWKRENICVAGNRSSLILVPILTELSQLLLLNNGCLFLHLTLRLLISYIYMELLVKSEMLTSYIYMDLRLATLKQSLSICCTMFQH